MIRAQVPAADGVTISRPASAMSARRQPAFDAAQSRGRWQHWGFTKNATTGHMRIYFNGALLAEVDSKTQVMQSSTIFTNGRKCNGTLGYEVSLDELHLYDS